MKRLRRQQRSLSRRRKGSANREKQRRRVARTHERVANIRRDFIHKSTTRLVRENQAVCCEDLSVMGMMARPKAKPDGNGRWLPNGRSAKRGLARSVSDAALGEVLRQLGYKCAWYGRDFVQVSRWYPSSKTCGACGYVNPDVVLGVEEWTCPECGAHHDRDLNAAVNIEREGLRILAERNGTAGCAGTGDATSSRKACGESVRPVRA